MENYIQIILSISGKYLKKNKKEGLSVNYFTNLGIECHFFKLKYNEFSFSKIIECHYNLPFIYLQLPF